MAAPAQTPPPVADFSTLTLDQVQAAVAPGEPKTMTTAGTTFDTVSKHLKDLSVDLNKAALDLAGGDGPWTGEGATAFSNFANRLATNIGGTGLTMGTYQGAMDHSAQALTDAKAEIDQLVKDFEKEVGEFEARVAANPPGTLYGPNNLTPEEAIQDLEEQYAVLARKELTNLAKAYESSGISMRPVDPGAANPTPVEPDADNAPPDENPENAEEPDAPGPGTETDDPNTPAPGAPGAPNDGAPLDGRPSLAVDEPVPPTETAAGLTGGALGNPGGPPLLNLDAPGAPDDNVTPPAVGDPRLVTDPGLPDDPTTRFTGGAPPPSVGNPNVPAPPSLTVPSGPAPGGGPLLGTGPLPGPGVPNRSLPTGPGPSLKVPGGSAAGPNLTSPNSVGGLPAGPGGIGAPGGLDGTPRILGEGPIPGGPARPGGTPASIGGGFPPMMGSLFGAGAGAGGGERQRNTYRTSTPASSVIGRYYTTPHGAYEDEDERLEEHETWLVEEDETVWEGDEQVAPEQRITADHPGSVASRTSDSGTAVTRPAEIGTTREATA